MNKTPNSSVINVLLSVLLAQALATMLQFGKNQVYQIGVSYGEELRTNDDDLDPKELDAEILGLTEQLGKSPVVGKLLGSEEFLDGVTFGYYKQEILDSAPYKKAT